MRSMWKWLVPLAMLAAGCSQQPFTVDVSLRVVSVAPSGGSEGFERRTPVVISFSEALDPATVTGENVSLALAESGEAVSSAVSYDEADGHYTVTAKPDKALAWSTNYRLTLATGLKRKRDGAPLSVKVTSDFKTQNPEPLRLVAATPSAGAAGAARNTALTLVFSEPVKCDTLGTAVKVTEKFDIHPRTAKAAAEVKGTWDCKEPTGDLALEGPANCSSTDASLCTVTFKPADSAFAFEWSSNVTIALTGRGADKTKDDPAAVKSFRATKDGGYLEENVTVPFHVEDPPAFTLSSVNPSASATGADRKPDVKLTFSEPVRCQTLLDPKVVAIEEVQDAHPRLGGMTKAITGSWTVGGKAVTSSADCPTGTGTNAYACKPNDPNDPCLAVFTPAAQLEWSSSVRVTLKGGAYTPDKETAGEPFLSSTRVTTHGGTLTTDVTYDFRVADPPSLQILNVLPGSVAGDLKTAPATLLRDGALVVQFSEPASCATLNDKTVTVTEDVDGPTGNAAVAVPVKLTECDNKPAGTTTQSLTIGRQAGQWSYSSIVTLTLAGGPFGEGKPAAYPGDAAESAIATTHGGQLKADTTFTFITQDPPQLIVLHTAPGIGQLNAPLATPIKVTFNQPVNIGSFTAGTGALSVSKLNAFDRSSRTRADVTATLLPSCTLACADANNDGQSDLDDPANAAAGSTCTCTPVSPLDGSPYTFDYSEAVTAKVAASTTSSLTTWRSGALGTDLAWTFRTVDPKPLLIAWTSPSDHDTGVQPKMYCDTSGNCTAAPPANGGAAVDTNSGIQIHFDRAVDCSGLMAVTTAGPNILEVRNTNARDAGGNLITPAPIVTGGLTCATGDESSVIFMPDAALPAAAHIVVTAKRADIAKDAASATSNTGFRSKDWTDATANDSGTLVGGDYKFGFDVALPPLAVVDSFPKAGEPSAPPNTKIFLVFNQDVACDATHNELSTQFSITGRDTANAVLSPTVTFNCATDYDKVTHTAAYTVQDPDPRAQGAGRNFVPGAKYVVTLKGGTAGPVGTNGQSHLITDYTLAFTVSSTTLRGYEIPPNGSTGISPDQVICEVFTRTLTNTAPDGLISATFVDATGRKVQVQGDAQFWSFPDTKNAPNVGAPTSNPKTTPGNAVCLVPKLASYSCLASPQKLPYSTDFTVSVQGATAPGEAQNTAFTWAFRTIDPPQIKRAVYQNDVLAGPAAESLIPSAPGTVPSDVPVNSQFAIDFANPLDKATVASSVSLVNQATNTVYGICPATAPAVAVTCLAPAYGNFLNGDATKPQQLTLMLQSFSSVATTPVNMNFATGYALTLKGGAQSGLAVIVNAPGSSTTGYRDWLPVDVSWKFVTSPATFATINPASGQTFYSDEEIPVVFTRPIRFSTANTNNLFGRDCGVTACAVGAPKMTGIVALNAADSFSAVLITSPTYVKGDVGNAVVTTDVQDYRGNPLKVGSSADAVDVNAAAKTTWSISNTPSLASQGTTALGCGSLAPNGGACTNITVLGKQAFLLTFGTSSTDRMLPGTMYGDALKITVTTGGCGDTVGSLMPLENHYNVAAAGADSVTFISTKPFRKGCTYALKVDPSKMANIFNLQGSGALGGAAGIPLTPETTPPALTTADFTFGTTPLASATTVPGDASFTATFSENMDPATFANRVHLTVNTAGGATVPVTVSFGTSGNTNVATITPAPYLANKAGILQGGTSYKLTVDQQVSDIAGNTLTAPVSVTFTVENTKPTFVSSVVAPNSPTAGQRTVMITMSEAIDPASLVTDTFDANNNNALKTAGSIHLQTSSGTAVAACASVDPTNPKVILLTTTDNNVAAGAYKVVLDTTGPSGTTGSGGVTDMAGNPLAAAVNQNVTF